MELTSIAKKYFTAVDEWIGPFDRPFKFRPFSFDAGGALNFLTIRNPRNNFVTYVSWDLFGHEQQKHGKLGHYEFLINCNEEKWVLTVITNLGRQSLIEVFESGDTMDIGPWVNSGDAIQGVVFEEAFKIRLFEGLQSVQCGILRCIGVTRSELEFGQKHGVSSLIDRLKRAGIYPNTDVQRDSIAL